MLDCLLVLLSVASTSLAGLITTTDSTTPAPSTTGAPKPTHSVSCSYEYCDGTSSWCYYWAGITAYDPSRGPIPGVTRSPLGSCDPATYLANTTSTTQSTRA
ncbi:hypothetical protein V2G26_013956 [Clonostachys chloroleuca]